MSDKINKLKYNRNCCLNDMQTLCDLAGRAKNDRAIRTLFRCRTEEIENIRQDFFKHHNGIVSAILSAPDQDNQNGEEEEKIREAFMEQFYTVKAVHDDLFTSSYHNETRTSITNATLPQNINMNSSNVRLPKIDLIKFAGDYKEFDAYIDLFNALVHENPNISDVEKFNYMKSSLEGQPLSIIRNLKTTSDNYIIAYESIVKRYSNKRLKAKAHWDAINNTTKVNSGDGNALRKLLDIFSENLTSLTTMGFPTKHWNFILVMTLMQRLDQDTITFFEQLEHKSNEVPLYENLFNFLENQCIALNNVANEAVRININHATPKPNRSFKPNPLINRTSSFFTFKSPSNTCAFCKDNHSMYTCNAFANKSPAERYTFCKKLHLCFNCLSSAHDLKSCRSNFACRRCSSKMHHTLLHPERNNITHVSSSQHTANSSHSGTQNLYKDEPRSVPLQNTVENSDPKFVGQGLITDSRQVLLATARIDIADHRGYYHTFRCMLDSGSMTSFITEKAANKLKLPKSAYVVDIKGLDSMSSTIDSARISFNCKPFQKTAPLLHVDAIVVQKICDKLPCSVISTTNWTHINNLCLADPNFSKPGNIDILLGGDIFGKVLLNGIISSNDDCIPDAINTVFGYVILGKTLNSAPLTPVPHRISCHFVETSSLNETLQHFWKIENVPESFASLPNIDECENYFIDTHTRIKEGNYVVALPFKDNCLPVFSGMRDLALSRFYSLEKRLLRNKEIYIEYSNFLKEYLELGHMELISSDCIPENSYYLPHHAVVKSQSLSTKLRVVFNAAAHLPGQLSLNDYLLVGPKLQQDIVFILLHFRLNKYAVCTDIKQMYRMIHVQPSHCDYQRIIWRFSPKQDVQDYRLTRVTYGVNSAPFLSLRVLRQLVCDEGNQFPLASHAVLNFCYIDDFVFSCPSYKNALDTVKQLILLMKKGGFELRKWSSNDITLLDDLPSEHLSTNPLNFNTDQNISLKILGLQWEPVHDCFSFSISPSSMKCTKRILLSELAKIYDPLGFLAPITFYCKTLIKQLWSLHFDWDEAPSDQVTCAWRKYQNDLPCLSLLKIPRYFANDFRNNTTCKYELHGFSDASLKGYACVIYFRIIDEENNIKTSFVCAKSKIAPTKPLTIPRLELSAAILLTKLIMYVKECFQHVLNLDNNDIFAWSDSHIVLHWINGSPSRWKTFVSHRVSFIQQNLPASCWGYVDSANNPADIASRGILPSDFMQNSLWFTGPLFLLQPKKYWPKFNPAVSNIIPNEEAKTVLLALPIEGNCLSMLLNKFSKFVTLRNTIAYLLRFAHNAKNPHEKRVGVLSSTEMVSALIVLVKYTQQIHFENEITSKKFSKPLRKLQVFVDDDDLLRVGGRLKHSTLSFTLKHPLLLPRSSELTTLIIRHFHESFYHTTRRTTYYLILQNFWILSAKRAINSVLSKCMRCWKINPQSYQPPMGDLPFFRITQVKPFVRSAVDFAGPFNILMSRHRGNRTCKAYLCIFMCLATKACHLELASDLSTDTFLAALQRFIARRGTVSHLYSDCGTNFLGAQRELLRLMEQAAARQTIVWHPSPPGAPHFNGLIEAGVKNVKLHLTRVTGNQLLTYEEYYTVLSIIESILNSRPLIPMSSDIDDIQALTPGHFLTIEPVTAIPIPDYTEIPLNRLSRWQLLQRLHQDFWRRWHSEYLHTLQQRAKWHKPCASPEIGSLVLVKTDNLPPSQWVLGRITEVHPGKDQVVRVATVKTNTGTFKRPLVKLCPLPTE